MQAEGTSVEPQAWDQRKLTPMLRQYVEAKALCPPHCILMFRMGDFFELFFDDAQIAARELGITLTARDKGENPIPMAGVPHHAIASYIAKLVNRGFSVALCDQMEDPRQAKGIVRREITRLITPGTSTDFEALEPGAATYLACAIFCHKDKTRVALAFLDLLAGQLLCTTVDATALVDEVDRMGVKEILLPDGCLQTYAELLGAIQTAVRPLTQECVVADAPAFLKAHLGTAFITGLRVVAAAAHGVPQDGPGTRTSVHALHESSLQEALATVIAFAETTQRAKLDHLSPPRAYDLTRYLMLDETTRRNLELFRSGVDRKRHGSLLWHLDRCRTSMGSRLMVQWLLFPLQDLSRISRRADAVAFFKTTRCVRQAVRDCLGAVHDVERLTGRVAVKRATPRDLGALQQSLTQVPHLRTILLADVCLQQEAWLRPWQALDTLDDLRGQLATALADDLPLVATEGGIFREGYRDDLDDLIMLSTKSHAYLAALEVRERARTRISSLKVRYNRVYGYFLEVTRANIGQVPPDYIRKQTLVNAERYVTQELKDFEDKVIDADARRRTREAELFQNLLVEVIACIPRLRHLAHAIARVDVLAALGEVAEAGRYTRPELGEAPVLHLTEARHAVLERLMPNGERFVPNDLQLDARTRQLLVVTGPNMAGKSTAMRQAALCVIMAQMGSFVPAKQAQIGLCDRIFTRVGAADNLGRGQSTFMVEMVETATILRCASARSLVLLDEIGRGTSTFDGVSIAWAVAEYLHDAVRCRGMFATHYHELIALANTHGRIFNASVAIKQDGDRIVFLRHLVDGGASRSFGLEVARMAALPDTVLQRAQVILYRLETTKSEAGSVASSASTSPPMPSASPVASSSSAPLSAHLAAGASALPFEEGPTAQQLTLFTRPTCPPTAAVARPVAHAPRVESLECTLARLDINHMTPVQALSALARLKAMLKQTPKRPQDCYDGNVSK